MRSETLSPLLTRAARFSVWWIVAVVAGIVFLIGLYGFFRPPRLTPTQAVGVQFRQDIADLDSSVSQLQRVIATRPHIGSTRPLAVQVAFRRARLAYKRIEFLTAYYSPETTRALNGPNLPQVDDDGRVNEPEGFQVLEERLFPDYDPAQRSDVSQTVAVMRANVNRLRLLAEGNELTDSHVFDAMRLEVFRIVALGITGFDSPVAFHSLPEAISALTSLRRQLAHYNLTGTHPQLASQLDQSFAGAIGALRRGPDFDRFNRLEFIKNHASVLSGLLLNAQRALGIPVFTESRLLSASARTLTDAGAFDAGHFVNSLDDRPTPGRVALGKHLFGDPILSGSAGRTCATCHQPDRTFTDGEPKSRAVGDAAGRTARNAPTLLNAALQAAQFMDSRVLFLEDQAADVIASPTEMHGSLPAAVQKLNRNDNYRQRFARAYPTGVTERTIRNALASYIRSLTSLDSRLDRYLRDDGRRGPSTLLTDQEKRGFNLFMGKGKCATCHFFPLFNGTVPPAYAESESEVIGTPATTTGHAVDPDVGKFVLTKREPHRYAFKTPTVRHAAKTAPYMHNGVFRTLEEVVQFYDRGGGRGLGFDLPNQTLPFDKLHLTQPEKQALVAFMKAL